MKKLIKTNGWIQIKDESRTWDFEYHLKKAIAECPEGFVIVEKPEYELGQSIIDSNGDEVTFVASHPRKPEYCICLTKNDNLTVEFYGDITSLPKLEELEDTN